MAGTSGVPIDPFVLYGDTSTNGDAWFVAVSSEVAPPPGLYAGTIGEGPGGPTPVLFLVEPAGDAGTIEARIEVHSLGAPLVWSERVTATFSRWLPDHPDAGLRRRPRSLSAAVA